MDFDFDDDDDLWSESEEEKPPSEPEVEEHLKPTPLPPLIEQLKELSVFKGCTNVLLDVLSDWVQETRLEPGETVTMIDGDPFYLVRSGAVCVQVADGPTITLGPGTVLNMPGMLGLHAEAEPFKPKARHGGETDSSPGAKFLQLKDDLERIEALRAGSYEAYMPNALPSSVFAERKRSVGSMEARSATSAMDDAVCFWTLCPSSFVHQEHGRKTTDWLPLSVHGAQPGEMPTHEGGKIVDYEQGGALLATLTKNSIEEMIFTLGRTAENAAELRIEIDKFNNNWEDIANVWRTIISRSAMSLRGALQLSRRTMMKVELPQFTQSRFAQRYNMMAEDRIKWYNWNLACVLLTAIPPLWMYTVNYKTCEEVDTLNRCLNPTGAEKIKYDLRMYG